MYKKVTKVKEYFTDREGNEVTVKTEGEKFEDVIVMDIPLAIRMLEYVREKLTTDVEVHKLAKVLTEMSEDFVILRMTEYDKIMQESMKP